VTVILDTMNKIFTSKDPLLASQAMVPIYYLVIKQLNESNTASIVTRKSLINFGIIRKENRINAENNFPNADFELLEFDRMSLQGTNDASSIRERVRILKDYLELL
jgi:hypothetical protein